MKHTISIALAMLLAACGGGGDSPPRAAVPERAPVPEGVYNGDTALTDQFNSTLVALEKGETWYFGTRNWGRGIFTYRGTGPGYRAGTEAAIYRSDAFEIVGTGLSTVPLPGATITQDFQYTDGATGPTVQLLAPQTEVAIMPRIPADRYVYEQSARLEALSGDWGGAFDANARAVPWSEPYPGPSRVRASRHRRPMSRRPVDERFAPLRGRSSRVRPDAMYSTSPCDSLARLAPSRAANSAGSLFNTPRIRSSHHTRCSISACAATTARGWPASASTDAPSRREK